MAISSINTRREHTVSRASGIIAPRPTTQPLAAPAVPAGMDIALGARLRDWKTLLGFGLSAAIILFFILTAHLDLATIWVNIQTADGRYLALALGVYFGAFILRGLRWQLLLRRADLGATVQLPPLNGLIQIIYLSWFVNCLVPAKLGDGYRAYLLKKHTGADLSRTLGTIVGERMADVLALVVLLLGSGLLILGTLAGVEGNLPLILLVGLALAAAIVGAVVGLRLGAASLARRLPARWRPGFVRFTEGLLRTFRRDIQLPLYALTGLIWSGEVLRIWLVLGSFHITGLAPGVIVFTALAGSLLSTIPFTPAGLGAVEGASVTILRAFGVATGLAGAVAILDRVINYWSNIPLGALLYLTSRWK